MNSHREIPQAKVALLWCFALFTYPVVAANIEVATTGDAGAGTLRSALENAASGDTITFHPDLDGESITLVTPLVIDRSLSIDASEFSGGLVIDGDSQGLLLIVNDGDGDSQALVSLINLRFQNGAAGFDDGGAIQNHESITIVDCHFEGNSASNGGALYNEPGSQAKLQDCHFAQNSVSLAGGAIHAKESELEIYESTFYKNSANTGGAVYHVDAQSRIESCSFEQNNAAGGATFYNVSSNPIIINCSITGGSSAFGGGFYNINSSGVLINCALAGNQASVFGGGMYNSSESSPRLINCTLASNRASSEGGAVYNANSSPTLINCILWGNNTNVEGDPVAVESGSNLIEGIDGATDPLFVRVPDPLLKDYGDLNLLPSSPAIDRANYAAYASENGPGADLSGITRLWDNEGTVNSGSGSIEYLDIGAFEFTPPSGPPVITLLGEDAVRVQWGTTWNDPGAIAIDGFNGNPEVQIGGDTIDTSTPGVYQITYDAIDPIGFPAIQRIRQVTVLDKTLLQEWAENNGLSLDQLAEDSSSQLNRLSYLERYAFGLGPFEPARTVQWTGNALDAPGLPRLDADASASPPSLAYYFVRRIDSAAFGLNYSLRSSDTMDTWTEYASSIEIVATSTDYELACARIPITSDLQFWTLSIEVASNE